MRRSQLVSQKSRLGRPRFKQRACGYREISMSVIVYAIPEFILGNVG
jgi:hypothetical protein